MTKEKKTHAKYDWEAIERDWRPRILTNRELSRLHGPSEGAIRKRAIQYGWKPDLTKKIKDKVNDRLANPEEAAKTDAEIVDLAAATVVQVVRSHRKQITRGMEAVDCLLGQLTDDAVHRDKIEAFIEEQTAIEDDDDEGDKKRKLAKRDRMMKAINLGAHASVAVNLTNALKNLITLERQSFNLDQEQEGEKGSYEDRLKGLAESA
jgi:hypothetical protein